CSPTCNPFSTLQAKRRSIRLLLGPECLQKRPAAPDQPAPMCTLRAPASRTPTVLYGQSRQALLYPTLMEAPTPTTTLCCPHNGRPQPRRAGLLLGYWRR